MIPTRRLVLLAAFLAIPLLFSGIDRNLADLLPRRCGRQVLRQIDDGEGAGKRPGGIEDRRGEGVEPERRLVRRDCPALRADMINTLAQRARW